MGRKVPFWCSVRLQGRLLLPFSDSLGRRILRTSSLGGSRKFPRFDDTFRAKRLHRFLQSVMTVCASSTESNASTESTSSRTREQNDSTNGFCHGEPGSMKLRPAAL